MRKNIEKLSQGASDERLSDLLKESGMRRFKEAYNILSEPDTHSVYELKQGLRSLKELYDALKAASLYEDPPGLDSVKAVKDAANGIVELKEEQH